MSDKIIQLNSSTFDSAVATSAAPLLVDFWAEWCGPCKAIAPVLDQLANEYNARLSIAKVNVDENQDLAVKYDVRSIPTLLLFKNGALAERIVGALPKASLKARLDPKLA